MSSTSPAPLASATASVVTVGAACATTCVSTASAAPLISAAASVVGVTTTVATAVGVHLGRYSASGLTEQGGEALDNAHALINKRITKKNIERGEHEDFVLSEEERHFFVTKKLNPLQSERKRLTAATETYFGSVSNWNSARRFNVDANTERNAATILSSEKEMANTVKETRPDKNNNSVDEETPQTSLQQTNQMVAQSYHQQHPSISLGHGGYNHPPVDNVRSQTIVSSQQSYSTALPYGSSTTQRHGSRDFCESPVTFESPSFANVQGYTYGGAQNSTRHSSGPILPTYNQYHSASPATKKRTF